jgi:excisionase family DNA binding protein
MKSTRGTVTTGRAAKALNLPAWKVIDLVDKGAIKATRKPGIRRIPMAEVMRYAESAR